MMSGDTTEGGLSTATSTISAVVLVDAEICYMQGQPVLNGMHMNVPHGAIYGLLGSSGCGKTTALSCILGQKKLDRGEIRVYNYRPGSKECGVPGRNVGYMPQDISLYREFSIKETLCYFGGLVGMDKELIKCRVKFMINLMDLPIGNRRVGTLSGGQQRRVSLATALIHDPKLLILDEPTVGVDPILRQRIWQHLKTMVETKQTTVIITSHYIEECRQADVIGVMRDGRLLTEKPPIQLFHEHNCNSLETIILNLCRGNAHVTSVAEMTVTSQAPYVAIDPRTHSNVTSAFQNSKAELATVVPPHASSARESLERIRTLTTKNAVVLIRNPLLLGFIIISQAFMLVVFCFALGKTPTNLGLGIVNHEIVDHDICHNITALESLGCTGELLSCQFLRSVPHEIFNMIWYDSDNDAVSAIQAGNIWGYVSFPRNYSEHFVDRLMIGPNADDMIFNNSQISIHLDQSDAQITIAIKLLLYRAYHNFLSTLMNDCGLDSRQVELPLKDQPPIFGTEETDFREYLVPGITVGTLLQYASFTLCIRLIGEKKSGVLGRSIVSGVKPWEIMFAYFITEFPVLLSQTIICYLIITVLFGIQIMGSHFLVIIIFMVTCYQGTSAGYLMGMLLDEEYAASVINVAIFFPIFFISGLWWPVEGMFTYLRYISPVALCTLVAEAARSVISRGWEFTHPNVWPGVAVPVAYTAAFIILTCIVNRYSQKFV